MPARFKPNDIIALPDGLCYLDRPAFFTSARSPRSVFEQRYCGFDQLIQLDGAFVRLTDHTFALLGLSVKDDDSYLYQAELVERQGRRWVTAADLKLEIPGNFIAQQPVLHSAATLTPSRQFAPSRPPLRQPAKRMAARLK